MKLQFLGSPRSGHTLGDDTSTVNQTVLPVRLAITPPQPLDEPSTTELRLPLGCTGPVDGDKDQQAQQECKQEDRGQQQ